MGKNVIVITVDGEQYGIVKNGISDFALIGVLECVLADLKSVPRKNEVRAAPKEIENEGQSELSKDERVVEKKEAPEMEKAVEPVGTGFAVGEGDSGVEQSKENSPVKPGAPVFDLKSRIINARQAIRDLEGEVEDMDLSKMTDLELQTEFEELTAQYKRLKGSQATKKR